MYNGVSRNQTKVESSLVLIYLVLKCLREFVKLADCWIVILINSKFNNSTKFLFSEKRLLCQAVFALKLISCITFTIDCPRASIIVWSYQMTKKRMFSNQLSNWMMKTKEFRSRWLYCNIIGQAKNIVVRCLTSKLDISLQTHWFFIMHLFSSLFWSQIVIQTPTLI